MKATSLGVRPRTDAIPVLETVGDDYKAVNVREKKKICRVNYLFLDTMYTRTRKLLNQFSSKYRLLVAHLDLQVTG